ncbi:MAG: EamA family transporter, partial [Vogesella sp.]
MARFFPLLAVLIWAANTVVSKAAANVLDPAAISFYRWLVALLV